MKPRTGSAPRHPAGSPFHRPEPVPTPVQEYAVDDRVTHDRHGVGTVIAVSATEVTVDFGSQTLRVPLASPKLQTL